MSNFKEFRNAIPAQFNKMTENVNTLFETDVDKDELWNLYLDSFPAGSNPIYRERRERAFGIFRLMTPPTRPLQTRFRRM